MKKLSILIAATLATAGLTAPAQAEFYYGAKLGLGLMSDACSLSSPCDDDSFGYGAYGGYNFTERLGLELGLDAIGDFKTNHNYKGTNYSTDSILSAISIAPKYTLPLTESVDLFAKAGAAFMSHSEAEDTVFTVGFGSEFELTQSLALRLEYQYFDGIEDKFINDVASHFTSIGLTYTFGGSSDSAAAATAAATTAAVAETVKEEPIVEKVVQEEKVVVPTYITKQQQQKTHQNLFANNSSELSAAAASELEPVLAILLAHPEAKATIVGHTDSSGSEAYNLRISEKRAQTVADYFEQKGVSSEQLTVSGEGEANPIVTNTTREGRSQNRRVDITVPGFEYQVLNK